MKTNNFFITLGIILSLVIHQTIARTHYIQNSETCQVGKCASCSLTSNELRTTLSCNVCFGYEKRWKDSSNIGKFGAECKDKEISLDHCDVAQPENDPNAAQIAKMTPEERKFFEKELEARHGMLIKHNGKGNKFAQDFGKMLAAFKSGINSLKINASANDRSCYICKHGYYLDSGKCKEADPIDNCEIFSSASICYICAPGYWAVKKTDTTYSCEEAPYSLRVRNCYYHYAFLKNSSPKCYMCDRGYKLGDSTGRLCTRITDADTAGYIWNIKSESNAGYPGCNPYFHSYSSGVIDWNSSNQICEYTWFRKPYTIHLTITVVLLVILTVLLVIFFNKGLNLGNWKSSKSSGGDGGQEPENLRAKEGVDGQTENEDLEAPLNPVPVNEN